MLLAKLCNVQVAQAVLVPFLVDKTNVGGSGLVSIKKMMLMQPAPDFQARLYALHALALLQVALHTSKGSLRWTCPAWC